MTKSDRRFEDIAPGPATPRAIGRARVGAPKAPSLVEALREAGVDSFAGEPANLAALEIGDRIRVARLKVGLTQAELARRAGCKQSDLSDIERGKGRDGPSYKTLKAIAVGLGAELPVNPPPPEKAARLHVLFGDTAQITCRATDYDKLYPLYTELEWTDLGHRVKTRLEKFRKGLARIYDDTVACQIVNVGPSQRARFRCDEGFSVISMVRGGGDVRVRRPFHRFHASESGAALAILNGDSEFTVNTGDDESCVFMMVPAGVLIAQTDEADSV